MRSVLIRSVCQKDIMEMCTVCLLSCKMYREKICALYAVNVRMMSVFFVYVLTKSVTVAE